MKNHTKNFQEIQKTPMLNEKNLLEVIYIVIFDKFFII